MYGVYQRINAIAGAVNTLSSEIKVLEEKIGNERDTPTNTSTTSTTQQSLSSLEQTIETVKKDIEILKKLEVKKEIQKELCVFETTLSKKLEQNMTKLLNDKLEMMMMEYNSKMSSVIDEKIKNMVPLSSTTLDMSALDDDYEINVTLAGENETEKPIVEKKKGGRKKIATV